MITRNFKNLIRGLFYSAAGTTSTVSAPRCRARDMNGDYRNTDIYIGYLSVKNQYKWFKVGTGTTAPTIDDYCMENENTDLQQLSLYIRPNYTDDNSDIPYIADIITITATYKNNTSNNITISELGFGVNSNYDNNNKYLLCHEVLDEPVTIEPGKVYTFTMTIN